MQIIRSRSDSATRKAINSIARQYAIEDLGLAIDLSALFKTKGNGIPSKQRIEALAKSFVRKKLLGSELGAKSLITLRASQLRRICSLPYFQALAAYTSDSVDALKRLFHFLFALQKKLQAAQCIVCKMHANCEFGKQYGDSVANISTVIDPDYALKVNPSCPELPQIAVSNKLFDVSAKLSELISLQSAADKAKLGADDPSPELAADNLTPAQVEQSMAPLLFTSGEGTEEALDADPAHLEGDDAEYTVSKRNTPAWARTRSYDNAHSGKHVCYATERLIDSLSGTNLQIWALGRTLDIALAAGDTQSLKPTVEVSRTAEQARMCSLTDLPRVLPSELSLPDSVYEHKLLKNELAISQQMQTAEKRHLLYVLVDSSHSMGGYIPGSRFGLFTRGSFSALFTSALVRKVRREGGIMYVRFFTGRPGHLHIGGITTGRPTVAENAADHSWELLDTAVRANNYAGGGTDLLAVLSVAEQDVLKANQQIPLAKATILLVTDCEDTRDPERMAFYKNMKVPFSVLDLIPESPNDDLYLKEVAQKYYKLNSLDNVEKMIREVV